MSLFKTVGWLLFGRWMFYLITLISFSIIIRFISPSDYGIFVIAATFLIFADVFYGEAVENAILRQVGGKSYVAHSSFWVVLGFTFFISIILFLAAHPLAAIYEQKSLISLMYGISIVVFIQGLAAVPRALLLKEGRLKNYAFYSGLCNLIGAIVGVLAAYSGLGAWSFVLQQGALQLSMLLLCSISVKFFPQFIFSTDIGSELYNFIKNSLWSCILNVFTNRLDIIFLGLYFDSSVVGLYGLAKRLIQIIQELVASSFDKALISIKTKIGYKNKNLAYKQVVMAQSIVLFPAFIAFSILGENLIQLLFGAEWTAAYFLVALMAVGGIFRSMVTIERAELTIKGLSGTILQIRFLEFILGLALVVPFANLGSKWMAFIFTIRYIIGYLMVVKSRFVRYFDFYSHLKNAILWLYPVVVATVCMAIAGLCVDTVIIKKLDINYIISLGIGGVACATTYVSVLYLFRKRLLRIFKEY